MSAWRVALKAIHARGGLALPIDVAHEFHGSSPYGALKALVRFGLATSTGRQGGGANCPALYVLTPRGTAFAEGRLAAVRRPDKGYGRRTKQMIFVATWIDSLPRGIRLEPAPGQRVMEQCA